MKKIIFLFALISNVCQAQDTLKVLEMDRSFSLGNKNAFVIDIPQANVKTINSNWKTYLRQQSKRSTSEKNSEIVLPKGPIISIGTDSITIISMVSSEGTKIKLITFFMMNDSSFLSTLMNNEISSAAKHFIRQFGIKEYKNAVNNEMLEEQKKKNELEKKVNNLDKENESLRKDIKDNERTISRKRDEISDNEQEQSLKSSSILQEKTILNNFVGTTEQREKEQKQLKQLTKEKEKLQDNKESLLKKIDDLESENRSIQKRIDKNNEELIPDAKANVARQKTVVNNVLTKMNNIQ